ncbi:uncharacterized protein LOC143239755 [Tachypleus tridentatus]|uniref:uncharacterized protein LOC143239755 n=1 Tax=Tachypleus tridentatus TaxID=6853 RepID=UPI003FD41634
MSDMFVGRTEESNIIVITSVASLSGGTIIPHFTTVLEYEFWNDSPVRQFCLTQNIDHYSFQVVLSQTVSKITYISELPEYILHILKEPTDECFPNSEENVCYTIGSKKITRNPELLHLLERKHGLTIIERNYQQILNFLPVEKVKLYYADLVLDEETGVIVLNTHDLEDYLQVNDVINKLIMLSMKFGRCWLIVYAVKGQEILNQVMRRNIVKIISIGMQFSLMKSGYQVQVVYATGNDQLAEFISAIAKSSQQTSKIWSNPDLGDRNWLRGEHSKHENFLLRFPCLNSICAQLMLSSVSLKELLTLSWNHLKNTFPWINVRILKIFYQFINQPSAVHQISLLNSASSQSKEHAVNEASSSNILKLSFPVLSEPESFDLLNLNKTNTTQQNCAATLIPYHSDNSSVGKNETQKSLEWPKHKHFKNEFQENRDALNLSTWNEIQSFKGNELHCIDNPVLEGTSRSTWLGQGSHNYAQNAGFPFSLPQTYYPFGVSSACVHRCCGQQCKTDNLSGGYPSCTDNALAEHYKSVLVPQLMLDHDFQDIKPSHGLTATDNLNYVCRGPDDMYTRKFMVVDNVSKCQQRIQDFSCLYKTELLSQKDASQKELQQWGQKNVQLAQEQFSSLYRMQQQGQERKTSDYIVSGRSNLPINFKSSCWKDNKLSQVDNDTKNSAEQPAIQRKLLSNVGIAYPFHQLSTCFDESPPMDLDCSGNNSSPDYRGDLKQHRLQRNNHVILMPHKKPRLAYEKVQGKKGQTRLVFH